MVASGRQAQKACTGAAAAQQPCSGRQRAATWRCCLVHGRTAEVEPPSFSCARLPRLGRLLRRCARPAGRRRRLRQGRAMLEVLQDVV